MYIFLITKPGAKTSAYVTDMQMFDIDGLVGYVKETNYCDKKYWHDPMIRIGKINDEEFGVVSTKNLSLEIFEDIFDGKYESIKELLIYYPNEEYSINRKYPIFRKEVYMEYGIPKQ